MAQERHAATAAQQEQDDDEQAAVLEEAAVSVEQWAARLPKGAPWQQAFSTIAAELRTCLAGRAAMTRERAA